MQGEGNQQNQKVKSRPSSKTNYAENKKQSILAFLKKNEKMLTKEFGPISINDTMFGGLGLVIPCKASKNLASKSETIKEGDEIVIKIPQKLDESYLQRFDREKYYTTFLQHPNIVRGHYGNVIVLENSLDKQIKFPIIVQERIFGNSLKQMLMAGKRFSLEESLLIDKNTNNAYMYMHGRGVAHCDATIDNILISESGMVKIIDPGIAHDLNPQNPNITKEGSSAPGSPQFMPPEAHVGRRGKFTDDWISGVVQYIIIGRRPIAEIKPSINKDDRMSLDEILKDEICSENDIKYFIHEIYPRMSYEYAACIMQRIQKDTALRLSTEEISLKLDWLNNNIMPLYHPQYNKQSDKFEFEVENDEEKYEETISKLENFNEISGFDEFCKIANAALNHLHPPYTIEENDDKRSITYYNEYVHKRIQAIDTIDALTRDFYNYLLESRKKSKKTTSGNTHQDLKSMKELLNSIWHKDKHYLIRLMREKSDSNFSYLSDDKTIIDDSITRTAIDRTRISEDDLNETFKTETDVEPDEDVIYERHSQRLERVSEDLSAFSKDKPKAGFLKKALIGTTLLAAIGAAALFGYVKPQQENEKMEKSLSQSFTTIENCLDENNLNLQKAQQLINNIKNNTELWSFIEENGDFSLKYSNIESEYKDRISTKKQITRKLEEISNLLDHPQPKIGEADERLKEIEENNEYNPYLEKVNEINETYRKVERHFKEKITDAIEKPLTNAEEAIKAQNTQSAKEFTQSVENYIKRLNPVDYSDLYNRLNNAKKSVTDLENHDKAKSNLSDLLKSISDKNFEIAKQKIISLEDYLTKYENKEIKSSVENKKGFVQKCVESIRKLPDLKEDLPKYSSRLEELKKQNVVDLSNIDVESLYSKIDTTYSIFNSLEAQAFKKEHGYDDFKSNLESMIKNIESFKHAAADGKYAVLKISATKLDEIAAFIDNNYFKADCSERIKNGKILLETLTKLQQGDNKVIKDNLNDVNYTEFDNMFTNAAKTKENYGLKINLHDTYLNKAKLAISEDGKFTSEQQEAAEFVLRTLFTKGEYLKGLEYEQYLNEDNKIRMKPYIDVMSIENSMRETENHVRVTPYLVTEKQIEKLEEMIKAYKVEDVIKFNDEIISLSEKINEKGKIENILSEAKKEMNSIYDKLNNNSELSEGEKKNFTDKYNTKEKEMMKHVNQLITTARADLGDSKRIHPNMIKNARDAWFRIGQLYQQAGSDKGIMKNAYIQAKTYNSQFFGILPKTSENDRFVQERNEASEFEKRINSLLKN